MEVIDLTHEIKESMPCFGAKWHCKANIEQMGKIIEVGRNTKKLSFGSHCGTHIDSPNHFIENGKTIDKIALETLVGDVQIFDFSGLRENETVDAVSLEGKIRYKKVIFYFNWAKHFKDERFYKNYPFFSDDAARYLINQGVKLIGMDTPSPDDSRIKPGSSEDSKIHKMFLENEVILMEYLNIPRLKSFNGWKLIAMPLKIKDCDGSPARICIYKD